MVQVYVEADARRMGGRAAVGLMGGECFKRLKTYYPLFELGWCHSLTDCNPRVTGNTVRGVYYARTTVRSPWKLNHNLTH